MPVCSNFSHVLTSPSVRRWSQAHSRATFSGALCGRIWESGSMAGCAMRSLSRALIWCVGLWGSVVLRARDRTASVLCSCSTVVLGACSAYVPWQSPDVMLQELSTMSDVQLACAMVYDVCESCFLLSFSKKLLSVVRIFPFWLTRSCRMAIPYKIAEQPYIGTEGECRVRSSTSRLFEHRMVPSDVWDAKYPTGRPSRGLEIDVSVAVGGFTNGPGPSRNGFCVTEAACSVP